MPLIKVTTQVINAASIAAGARSSATVFTDCTKATQIAFTVKAEYDIPSSPTANILEIYASRDGVELDTTPFVQAQIPLTATSRMTIDVPASPNYLVAKVYNPSGAAVTTNVTCHATVQEAT